MKWAKIPRWSFLFIIYTMRIIAFGTLAGIILFPIVGLFIKTQHDSLALAWLGFQSLGLCSGFLGPIAALILTARKINRVQQSETLRPQSPVADIPQSDRRGDIS